MSLVKCRECGKEVSTEAKTCPHCGVSKPTPPAKVGTATTVISILVAVVIAYQCTKNKNDSQAESKPAPPTRQELESSARHYCSKFVERSAHDPSSIDWVDRLDWPTYSEAGGEWAVHMTFRAKNGFGATVLNTKTCRIKVNGENVSLLSLR